MSLLNYHIKCPTNTFHHYATVCYSVSYDDPTKSRVPLSPPPQHHYSRSSVSPTIPENEIVDYEDDDRLVTVSTGSLFFRYGCCPRGFPS